MGTISIQISSLSTFRQNFIVFVIVFKFSLRFQHTSMSILLQTPVPLQVKSENKLNKYTFHH